MEYRDNIFVIEKMYWERIFLNLNIKGSYEGSILFVLENDKGETIPLQYKKNDDVYSITINITCVHDRSFLENGRWKVAAVLQDENVKSICNISTDAAYKLDDCSRVFKYAENQMAYNISFGVISDDEKNLKFYIDSYFMFENRKWRKRRYIKEVRKTKDKVKRFYVHLYYSYSYLLSYTICFST